MEMGEYYQLFNNTYKYESINNSKNQPNHQKNQVSKSNITEKI